MKVWEWISALFGKEKVVAPVAPQPGRLQPPSPPPPTIELFAFPGHGRTTFVWAMVHMLRQLTRVWPSYLCWPRDERNSEFLKQIGDDLARGVLPLPWEQCAEGTQYLLQLRNLDPWGDRELEIWDRPDVVFSANQVPEDQPSVDWRSQPVWLLSIPDLSETESRCLDLALDDLVRIRSRAGSLVQAWPFRLVIVLTKADAIPDLPPRLRFFLENDPLARTVCQTGQGFVRRSRMPSAEDESSKEQLPDDSVLRDYFYLRRAVDEQTQEWLLETPSGRVLIERAKELGVELHFSLVSATGSGITDGSRLATAWSPRRVLDPYFWALDLE